MHSPAALRLISAAEFYLDLFSRAFSPIGPTSNDATERDELGGSGEKNGSSKGNGGAKGDAKGRSTESPPSTPEMGPDKTTAPSASNDLQFSRGSVGSSGAGSSETAMHRPETEPADESKGKDSALKGPARWKEPGHRKGNKGTSKGSKGKQPTNPREVRVPKTSGKGSPPSSPEPQEREEACAQEPEPVHAHQSAGAKESQPSSKASTPREESAHPSGSCSARSSELEKQEPEPAEPVEPAERA